MKMVEIKLACKLDDSCEKPKYRKYRSDLLQRVNSLGSRLR